MNISRSKLIFGLLFTYIFVSISMFTVFAGNGWEGTLTYDGIEVKQGTKDGEFNIVLPHGTKPVADNFSWNVSSPLGYTQKIVANTNNGPSAPFVFNMTLKQDQITIKGTINVTWGPDPFPVARKIKDAKFSIDFGTHNNVFVDNDYKKQAILDELKSQIITKLQEASIDKELDVTVVRGTTGYDVTLTKKSSKYFEKINLGISKATAPSNVTFEANPAEVDFKAVYDAFAVDKRQIKIPYANHLDDWSSKGALDYILNDIKSLNPNITNVEVVPNIASLTYSVVLTHSNGTKNTQLPISLGVGVDVLCLPDTTKADLDAIIDGLMGPFEITYADQLSGNDYGKAELPNYIRAELDTIDPNKEITVTVTAWTPATDTFTIKLSKNNSKGDSVSSKTKNLKASYKSAGLNTIVLWLGDPRIDILKEAADKINATKTNPVTAASASSADVKAAIERILVGSGVMVERVTVNTSNNNCVTILSVTDPVLGKLSTPVTTPSIPNPVGKYVIGTVTNPDPTTSISASGDKITATLPSDTSNLYIAFSAEIRGISITSYVSAVSEFSMNGATFNYAKLVTPKNSPMSADPLNWNVISSWPQP